MCNKLYLYKMQLVKLSLTYLLTVTNLKPTQSLPITTLFLVIGFSDEAELQGLCDIVILWLSTHMTLPR